MFYNLHIQSYIGFYIEKGNKPRNVIISNLCQKRQGKGGIKLVVAGTVHDSYIEGLLANVFKFAVFSSTPR
jgi:hypothetical protein